MESKQNNFSLKIRLGILFLLMPFVSIPFLFASGVFNKEYSAEEMIENYDRFGPAIQDVRDYVISVVPANASIELEYDGRSSIEAFHVSIYYPRIGFTGVYYEWTTDADSPEAQTQLSRLGWTQETLNVLYEKLELANCISVQYSAFNSWHDHPCSIGFKHSDTGTYSYGISDPTVSDTLLRKLSQCRSVFYKEGVVLQYDCGPHCYDCFPAE